MGHIQYGSKPMVANPKRELHELIDRLSDQAARQLSSTLRGSLHDSSVQPRPLREADIILNHPLLPDDEDADEMIEAVRRWRREGGNA
jgi:hypothetical protein